MTQRALARCIPPLVLAQRTKLCHVEDGRRPRGIPATSSISSPRSPSQRNLSAWRRRGHVIRHDALPVPVGGAGLKTSGPALRCPETNALSMTPAHQGEETGTGAAHVYQQAPLRTAPASPPSRGRPNLRSGPDICEAPIHPACAAEQRALSAMEAF